MKAYGRGEEPEIAAAKNPPAYGAWNVQRVTTGTGEALPGPVACVFVAGEAGPITGYAGKWASRRVGVGGGHSTAGAERTTQPPVREGPLLRRCVVLVLEESGECRFG